MAFLAKTDKFGLADSTKIVLVSTDEGKTASVAEAQGEDGSIVANEVFGEVSSPSCEYAVKSSLSGSNAVDVVLGGVTTVGTGSEAKYYALTELSIATAAGSAPTISAKGEEVPSATSSCCYTVEDGIAIEAKHHAQIILSAFTLTGTGCHVTDCSATFSSSFSVATKDGVRLAWDVTQGKIEVTATINQTGSTVPTVTAGTNWVVTSPLTQTNPDSDYPTYSVTLTKYLAKDAE